MTDETVYARESLQSAVSEDRASQGQIYFMRHVRYGWWSLLCFMALGLALESLHGFKVGWYLDVSNETRRLMWTLAHAHGTLLAIVHLIFGVVMHSGVNCAGPRCVLASRCLQIGSLVLPIGFFLAGIFVHDGDPGLGILLVPLGATLLLIAILISAQSVPRR